MVKSLTVTNVLGASKKLVLNDPYSSGILIANIEGIGVEEATIYTTDYASIDGAFFNSSRIPPRDITITLKPIGTDDKTIEDLRLEMYKYFPVRQNVTLKFETDNRIAEIYGYVNKNTAEIFSDDERITIGITCPDPYFYDVALYNGITETIFTGITQNFEFPFENDISEYLPDNIFYLQDTPEPEDHTVVTWETREDHTFTTNGTEIKVVSHKLAGDSETNLKIGSNTYRIYNQDGTDFTNTQFDLITHGDTSPDYIITLMYSDNRFYVQAFQRPRQYDKLSETMGKLIFGNRETKLERVIIYKGDVPIGFKFIVEVVGSITNLKIYNVDTRSTVTFDDTKLATLPGGTLHKGDKIVWNTVKGDKYIILERDGVEYSLLNFINADAEWFQLNVGDNVFSYTCSDIEGVEFSIRNRTAFIGI